MGEPSDKIQIKERGKIYTGQLMDVGSKEEIQQRLNSIVGESSQQLTASTTDQPCDEMHAVDETYHACALAHYPFVIIVVKKRKRAVEKATKQKSTDGKPPKRETVPKMLVA